jgi:peptide/nickel transport system permease protein
MQVAKAAAAQPKADTQWSLAWKKFRRNRLAVAGAVVLIVIVLLALLAPWISPYPPNAIHPSQQVLPPSWQHLLGTDTDGRDVLSRLLYGARISLLIGFSSMLSAVLLGTVIGAIAGFVGGAIDAVLMRLTDLMLSFPLYLILFVLSVIISGGITKIVVIIAILSWMYTARIVRAEVLQLRQELYVEAAQALGASRRRILWRHVLPNALAPLIANATLLVGNNIITESVLSFFGFGVQPPTASWGSMLQNAQSFVISAPWLAAFPGLAILITVLAVNFIGDGLRDALDPRGR